MQVDESALRKVGLNYYRASFEICCYIVMFLSLANRKQLSREFRVQQLSIVRLPDVLFASLNRQPCFTKREIFVIQLNYTKYMKPLHM